MNDVLTKVLLPTWIFEQVKNNEEISRLVLECKTKLVISCAYPGNYFLFPNLNNPRLKCSIPTKLNYMKGIAR
ncbi:hypothetical protein [Lysinibacillus xylanilyticus]|uniref:hypothetical protein n=1 Tax=Lysinibacillus xylanilyticus TaxID=582475 RepID=UPI0038095745